VLVVVLVLVLDLGWFFEDENEDEPDDDRPVGLSKFHPQAAAPGLRPPTIDLAAPPAR
jgi:hypothetical protein